MPPAGAGRADVVLLVNSDPAVRDLYRTALHEAGRFTVITARDEVDALRRLDASTPNVVVIDLAATRHNGRDLLAAMQLRGVDHVPVIAVTDADHAGLEALGFACVIHKPIDLHYLLDEILRCVAETAAPMVTSAVTTGPVE